VNGQTTLGLAAPIFYGPVQPELDQIPDPAAGGGFTIEVGANYYERPIALSFTFTTAAHAATRQVQLQLLDPGGVLVAAMPVASTQITTLTYQYSFVAQLSSPQAVAANVVISPLPAWVIPSSYSLAVTITNVYTTDQVTNIRYYRDRFSTDPYDYVIGGVATDTAERAVRRFEAVTG